MMNRSNIIQFLIIFVLTISCASQKSEGQEKLAQPPRDIEIHGNDQPKLATPGGERKNYVPGEILVKFHDGTKEKAIRAIKSDLHLETIRLVSKPNLYLMKILDGSSVENVLERLRKYQEVKYAEPNYVRTRN
jgi:hypothetical protein